MTTRGRATRVIAIASLALLAACGTSGGSSNQASNASVPPYTVIGGDGPNLIVEVSSSAKADLEAVLNDLARQHDSTDDLNVYLTCTNGREVGNARFWQTTKSATVPLNPDACS